ncbi:conserved hypothetical protein [Prochlorococcus marinus str. MIT 9515]|uniref:Uncharacterized protein n=1 Tax=Prochlorococcus marinus (strain MIT 9515) TaxID=167542 RepID=A2BZ57_PROM5|nr:conserved hypothetical protein [Prochlorococcus marinus str. MIT 9515]
MKGRRAMAHLIHLWHERNAWSHRVLPLLSEILDLGRVHNSQISNLRNGKLSSPGPEVFLALAQVNTILDQGIDSIRDQLEENHPELWRSLEDSALPLKNDSGKPLSAGELFEIFSGLKPLPSSFDWYIEDHEASTLSDALSDHFCQNRPWRYCKVVVMEAYTSSKPLRRERFAEVIAGIKDYTAEELDGELLDLYETSKKLSYFSEGGPNAFLMHLRDIAFQKKRVLKNEK